MAGWPHHQSPEGTPQLLDLFIAEDKVFAVCLKENGKLLGATEETVLNLLLNPSKDIHFQFSHPETLIYDERI